MIYAATRRDENILYLNCACSQLLRPNASWRFITLRVKQYKVDVTW